jgi:hypothetical protein
MNGIPFEVDIRYDNPNDTGRREAQFHEGWRRAIEGQCYQEETLRQLTWNNLGYRLGKLFGATSADHLDQMYDWCVRQQSRRVEE